MESTIYDRARNDTSPQLFRSLEQQRSGKQQLRQGARA